MSGSASRGRRRRWPWALLALWAALAVASNLWWWTHPGDPEPRPGDERVELLVVEGEALGDEPVSFNYRDRGSREPGAPALVLLHGSPGSLTDFDRLAERLPDDLRLLAPDLPGFGRSQRRVPDYSARAHARYVEQWLDGLGIPRAHLVAFSMGGAVALELADRAPERVASIHLVAALGVEELELFGRHDLNHLLHRAQTLFLQTLTLVIPHFGGADRWVLGTTYARNFQDTDQSRLRGCLERWDGPLAVLHGERDFLVPVEAAREHARVAPQAELVELDASHFLLWTRPEEVAELALDFARRAEAGEAATRADASPERAALAARPYDPTDLPPAAGPLLLLLMVILALGTLVSEDLATIAAGLMVAQGRLEFLPATVACCAGVYIGDMGLFLAGRWLGRPVVARRPLRWFLSEEALERASAWLRRRGIQTIFLSRLLPGLRLPTYFAAGVLRTRFLHFAGYFLVAVLVWTPLLVLFAAWLGSEAIELFERWGAVALIGLLVAILLVERVLIRLFTFRGRRALRGAWMRWTRWEFWPPWLFYPPLVLYVGWLALKHRSFTLVTAVNPAIPTGGFIGESKSAILTALDAPNELAARFRSIPATATTEERRRLVRELQAELDAPYPIVLKPDVGQRGSGVRILRDEAQLEAALAELEVDHLAQEFAPGPEYGVFHLRFPGQVRGRIFSITSKRFPELVGDGTSTVEELILRDPRAVAIARTYFALHAGRLDEVLASGERLQLVELGTHCRGAIFEDARELATPELERAFDELGRRFEGFYFGRYDLRAESPEAFRAGRGFKIIELNGLTSEATHIYDARTPLLEAWRTLGEQWRLAFEISAANRARGARPSSLREVLGELLGYRRVQRSHRN